MLNCIIRNLNRSLQGDINIPYLGLEFFLDVVFSGHSYMIEANLLLFDYDISC